MKRTIGCTGYMRSLKDADSVNDDAKDVVKVRS